MWEDFYLRWLRSARNILLVYYESLTAGFVEQNLKEITTFLDFEWNEQRMKCLSKHNKGKFQRKKACLDKGHLDLKSVRLNVIQTNNIHDGANSTNSFDVYTKKHVIWINSAIRKVKHEIERRGLDSSYISNYKNQNVRINICGEDNSEHDLAK